MRYFKFVGSEKEAESYNINIPTIGRIYAEDTKVGGGTVKGFALNHSYYGHEWQEVTEQEYLGQDYYQGDPDTLRVTIDTGSIKQTDCRVNTPDHLVNKPAHYNQGEVECIEAIKSATVNKKGIEAVCVANIIKYLWRYEDKGGVQDIEKAKWYLDKLLSEKAKDNN